MAKDYYNTLGVEKNTSKEEIKKAYKRLAKQYHPDLNPNNKEAEHKFKEINEAVSVLLDDQKRAQYDQFGTTDFGPGTQQGFDFSDFMRGFRFDNDDLDSIFDQFFGAGFGGRTRHRQRRGADLQQDMEITLENAYTGVKRTMAVERFERCEKCNGKGGDLEKCGECNGSGMFKRTTRTPFGIFQQQGTCRACSGSGQKIKKRCGSCLGDRVVRREKELEVDIPRGVDDGTVLRLRNEGEVSEDGIAGDLYLRISVKKHLFFDRRNDDIIVHIPISYTQAVLGEEIEVPTLNGKATVKIPSGTQPDTLFRMRGKGMPSLHGHSQGDELVRVTIKVPEKLSKRERELVEELAEMEKGKKEKGLFGKLF